MPRGRRSRDSDTAQSRPSRRSARLAAQDIVKPDVNDADSGSDTSPPPKKPRRGAARKAEEEMKAIAAHEQVDDEVADKKEKKEGEDPDFVDTAEKDDEEVENDEVNKNEVEKMDETGHGENDESKEEPEPTADKNSEEKDEKQTDIKEDQTNDTPDGDNSANDTNSEKKIEDDFVVVNKEEVPAAESEEVTDAIKAQGEDGQLLTGFVQVSKDEIPEANSTEIEKIVPVIEKTNSIENTAGHQNGGLSNEDANGESKQCVDAIISKKDSISEPTAVSQVTPVAEAK